jgi:hypothetical protein
MIYDNLKPEVISNIYNLFKFLRKLRIVGLIETKVQGTPPTMAGSYSLSIYRIHAGVFVSPDDELDEIFAKLLKRV